MTARKERMNRRTTVAAVIAVLSGVLLVGCDKPKSVDTSLVEVRIVGLWTETDFERSRKASGWIPAWYPHTIVEEIATGERCRVMGNSIGTTGEVCKVRRCDMKGAGE